MSMGAAVLHRLRLALDAPSKSSALRMAWAELILASFDTDPLVDLTHERRTLAGWSGIALWGDGGPVPAYLRHKVCLQPAR